MYNRFAESSRVNYFVNFSQVVKDEHKQAWFDLMTPKGTGVILKSIKTDYKFVSIQHPLSCPRLHTIWR